MADNKNHNLDRTTADNLLKDVLDSCNIPPSNESLNETMLKSALLRKPIGIVKIIATVCLILVVLSPLAFNADNSFSIVKGTGTVTISSHILYEDCFILTLSGDADYSDISAKKNNGAIIFPDRIDETVGLVIFPYDGDALNIYIKAKGGGYIQAVLNETK